MRKRNFLLVAGWLFHLVVWGQAAEQMDLSGIWRFQLDPMGFGKTPGSELYLSKLTETIHCRVLRTKGVRGYRILWRTSTDFHVSSSIADRHGISVRWSFRNSGERRTLCCRSRDVTGKRRYMSTAVWWGR